MLILPLKDNISNQTLQFHLHYEINNKRSVLTFVLSPEYKPLKTNLQPNRVLYNIVVANN